jgi:transcription elongation GreA/GreB family factor
MAQPDKVAVVSALLRELRGELQHVEAMARMAIDEATADEAAAENKYDTRSLEASYLATGQGERVMALRQAVSVFASMPTRAADDDAPVGEGTLVGLLDEDEAERWLLVAPTGGGSAAVVAGHRVQVITPTSPLGAALIGATEGDEITVPAAGGERSYEIIAVR